MSSVALSMVDADVLKLRKKRGAMAWVLALAPVVLLFAVKAIQHSSNALRYVPAGGTPGFTDGVRLLGLFFGPLAAVLIGVEVGSGDAAAGVFRDLVVTGRSRLAIFASRVPAALAVCWTVALLGYALVLLGTYAFASELPTPDGALVLNGLAFTLMAMGALCVVSVGFASLTTSRAASITALIGWQLVASPLLASIGSLGSARDAILSQAIVHFSPVHIGDRGASVSMSQGTALLVLAGWLIALTALGAWRTRRMDA